MQTTSDTKALALPQSLELAPARNRSQTVDAVLTRTLDLVLGTLILLLALPLLLALAIAIRIDSKGSPVFRQSRLGRDGKPFVMNKFRSMRIDADETRHRDYVQHLIASGSDAEDSTQGAGLYKLSGDDRVTRVGAFIRKWSLDELPQLWNVVRGQMSLVGPRPVLAYEVAEYPEWYLRRFAVKPGMTGLWQVSGRNERTYEEMVTLDLQYVDQRSVRLDAVILFRTVTTVMRRQGVA